MTEKKMSFDALMKSLEQNNNNLVIDRDEIVKQLIADGKAKVVNDLTVRNVTITPYETSTLVSITVDKPAVIGDAYTGETDEFGQPVIKLSTTNIVQTSAFALANVLKDNALTAIFANDVSRGTDICKLILVGGKIAVLLEYVPANTEWSNPFSRSGKVSVFNRDKVIHHIIGIEPGPLAQRLLDAKLAQF